MSPSANTNNVPEPLAGAMFRATVDRTSYINYGVDQNEISVLIQTGYFFRYSKEGTNAVVFDANPKRPLTISGFVWEGNTERLSQRHVVRHRRIDRRRPRRAVCRRSVLSRNDASDDAAIL